MTDPSRLRQIASVPASAFAPKPLPLAPESVDIEREFSNVFSEYFRYVHNTLKRLGTPISELEDLTHDVFLSVYRHWHERDESRSVKPWLFAFAYRTASAHRRLARHRREVFDSEEEPVNCTPNSLEQLVYAEQLRLVQQALERVELDHRAVFILHDLDEIPMPEVARCLNIPTNTGYSRLRAARRKFEESLVRLQQRGDR